MSLKTFLAKIGAIFTGLFNSAKRTWDKLEPKVKDALKTGSGIVAELNAYVDQTPDFVFEMLQKKFPDLSEEKIKELLAEGAKTINLVDDATDLPLLKLIELIQARLAMLEGKVWANVSQTIAKAIAAVIAPKETKFAVISSLMEFVYQTFFKKAN